MADNKNQGNQEQDRQKNSGSAEAIGIQQGTTQTGGQSSGGTDRRDREDNFTEDLRDSGDRSSRKEKGES